MNVDSISEALRSFSCQYDQSQKQWHIQYIFHVPDGLPEEKLSIYLQQNDTQNYIGHIISDSDVKIRRRPVDMPNLCGVSRIELVWGTDTVIRSFELQNIADTEVRWKLTRYPQSELWWNLEFICLQDVDRKELGIRNGAYRYQMPKDIRKNVPCRLLIRREKNSVVGPVAVEGSRICLREGS